jgi:hypothetical protein
MLGVAIPIELDFIPQQLHLYFEGGVEVDYFIAGGDICLAILKDEGLMPALSVGIGYSYMKGSIGMAVPGLASQTFDITALMNAARGRTAGSSGSTEGPPSASSCSSWTSRSPTTS